MSKFKVGDRARITKSYGGFGGEGLEVGDIVTITEVDRHLRYAHSGFHYAAQTETTLGSEVYDLFVEHELAPLLESPTIEAAQPPHRIYLSGLSWCGECRRAVDRGWPHSVDCSLGQAEARPSDLPTYVHVIESRQIWVTLPGDTAGHKLTETQARTLFHELEAIV